jgi:uncharacterized membrane protein YqjE
MQAPAGTGPLSSLRALGAAFAALVGTRVQLLVLEFREEGERRKEMLALVLVSGLFLALGLLLAAFLVVVVFWDTHRIAAISAVTALYLGIGAWAFVRLLGKIRGSPPAFQASLAELASDLEMLKERHE